jgi:phosphoglycerol transferase
MAAAMLGAVVVLRLWHADLHVPFSYVDDGNLAHMFVKEILHGGWYERTSQLGAPSGQELYDYPVLNGDTLNVLVIKVLGLFSSDSSVVLNLFYLLTYPLVALAAFLVLRRLRLSRPVALVCSILYTLLPYHFLRGEPHLLLTAYYAVPLGAYLVLSVLDDEPLFARRSRAGPRLLAYASRRSLTTVALVLVLATASGSFYYSGFTVVLVAAAALLRFAVSRSRRVLATGAVLVGVLVGLSLVQLAPSLVYRARHGTDPEVAHRYAFESEFYSLKLSLLVLPVDHHRIGALARAKARYETHFRATEARLATLGIVGTVGFLWLLFVALATCVGARTGRYRTPAAATVIAFLIATIGGFSTLIGYVYPQLRAWDRLSIFIAFYSFLAVGFLLDSLRLVLGSRLRRAAVFGAVLAVTLLVGVFDETTDAFIPQYGSIAAEYRSDGSFVRSIERTLGPHACVYQLPYIPFPETVPPGRMSDYDPVRGYLHSNTLRWTYGAIRGRPADWAASVASQPLTTALPAAARAGFRGVWVDRFGYADNGAAVERQLTGLVGAPRFVSPNGRFSFFDLRAYAQRVPSPRTTGCGGP